MKAAIEHLKSIGNEQFKSQNYAVALRKYEKVIRYINHVKEDDDDFTSSDSDDEEQSEEKMEVDEKPDKKAVFNELKTILIPALLNR